MVNLKKLCGGYIVDAGDTFSKTLLLVSIVFFGIGGCEWWIPFQNSRRNDPPEFTLLPKSLYPNEANPGKRGGGEYPELMAFGTGLVSRSFYTTLR